MITKYSRLRQKVRASVATAAEIHLLKKLTKAQKLFPKLGNKIHKIIKLVSS